MSVIQIHNQNFENEVTQSELPVVVDFWAPWCGYCRRLAPAVDRMADAYGEKIKVGKLNIDESPELAEKYAVDTIPTLLLFRQGRESAPLVNPSSQTEIDTWLQQNGVL